MNKFFLPCSKEECRSLSWDQLDVIIISGDAYVDHPSFGSALIGRWLVANGYRVGIIPQPDWHNDAAFQALGSPRLCFAISAGNMDSMVNHYTAQRKLRSDDAYSPDGKSGFRPDRATIVYAQQIRKLFGKIPILIGGVEASLRRIPHYDFWSDKIRNSILFDSRADLLIYGMAEKPVLETVKKLDEGFKIADLTDIPGTVCSVSAVTDDAVILPEFQQNFGKAEFIEMSKLFYQNQSRKVIYQKFSRRFLKHNKPALPLTQAELDSVYAFPFQRMPHPGYGSKKIPAFEQIKNSVTTHRGCFGGCRFCSINLHQGRTIQSRSRESISNELDSISRTPYFKGTISDLGGPSANMYGLFCKKNPDSDCNRESCLYPAICPQLETSHKQLRKMLRMSYQHPMVKNLFVASGIRFDLALQDPAYIRELAEDYTGGLLKLAPEHQSRNVLDLMGKAGFELYLKFSEIFLKASQKAGKEQYIIPYIMVGHPGETLADTVELAVYLKKQHLRLQQVQEFTPTPMTISTMMYYTGQDLKGNTIHVPGRREVKLQKALVQWYKKENRKYVKEALQKCGRSELNRFFQI